MEVSVVIPTLNAEKEIGFLLQKLHHQTVKLEEIIVIDSQSDDQTAKICRADQRVLFIPIQRSAFDHGGTRDRAFRQSHGRFVLFLTQDALPEDEHYVERLLRPFQDPAVAMVSGRQIAKEEASPVEKWVRNFNYPPESTIRTQDDIPRLGIKTFFASNVCSAYRRSAYLAVGGFDSPLLTNEDMLMAARLIHAGYKVAYCAEARVIHSHHLTLKQQFIRNYRIGVFMRRNRDVFRNLPASAEGMKLVNYVLPRLWKERRVGQFLYFCVECAVKGLAYQCGNRLLPLGVA
ncbi:MAG: glycosyltransferase [Dysgonamonadaceae bacterium]|jgi:rhamnosyltransferase|nr:glycosyltransferase [Dysgonamonadaceae bacterium]